MENYFQPRILYTANLSVKCEGRIKTLSGKQVLKISLFMHSFRGKHWWQERHGTQETGLRKRKFPRWGWWQLFTGSETSSREWGTWTGRSPQKQGGIGTWLFRGDVFIPLWEVAPSREGWSRQLIFFLISSEVLWWSVLYVNLGRLWSSVIPTLICVAVKVLFRCD